MGTGEPKKRTTITINRALYQRARELMVDMHFDDFSTFISHLIREDWQRRQAKGENYLIAAETPKPAEPPNREKETQWKNTKSKP